MADYPEAAKLPVIYSVGMAAGSCLAVGFYKSYVQALGVLGAALLLAGFIVNSYMNFKKKGIEQNGKKKDHSGQLENEYDAQ